ncbi:hypothetical protein BDB00DRAFT_821143 [Zychaea mexicana]|uniref:uncharacterized protein n=1 Tax=Zychaea mexicana TaxID=64656 RepID=UPI0022FF138F|nr:uncharacterized protein BDB00DRAFT_821143 [Zychaea mexicana]KAI9493890.1 hypothetical protein BDB00DRAFT_821143 [Zychaea mexicana]
MRITLAKTLLICTMMCLCILSRISIGIFRKSGTFSFSLCCPSLFLSTACSHVEGHCSIVMVMYIIHFIPNFDDAVIAGR